MAYGNGFPVTYPQYYPQMQSVQPPAPSSNSIIWVQGEAGAKSYLVAPNTTVQLWDSERQTIYLKSADASGMPSIKTLDYTIRTEAAKSPIQDIKPSEPINISRDDLNAIQSQIDAIRDELEACKNAFAKVQEGVPDGKSII